jgi:hypothetical protein
MAVLLVWFSVSNSMYWGIGEFAGNAWCRLISLKRFLNTLTRKKAADVVPAANAGDFLDRLPILTTNERQQLRSIGADSPASLYSAIMASPESFDRILGPSKIDRLLTELYELIPLEHRNVFENYSFSPPPLGVFTHEPSRIAEPDFDIEQKESLTAPCAHAPQAAPSREHLIVGTEHAGHCVYCGARFTGKDVQYIRRALRRH